MKNIKVFKPAPGRLVRDPITGQPLPEGRRAGEPGRL
jgi:hypothetical protein